MQETVLTMAKRGKGGGRGSVRVHLSNDVELVWEFYLDKWVVKPGPQLLADIAELGEVATSNNRRVAQLEEVIPAQARQIAWLKNALFWLSGIAASTGALLTWLVMR